LFTKTNNVLTDNIIIANIDRVGNIVFTACLVCRWTIYLKKLSSELQPSLLGWQTLDWERTYQIWRENIKIIQIIKVM